MLRFRQLLTLVLCALLALGGMPTRNSSVRCRDATTGSMQWVDPAGLLSSGSSTSGAPSCCPPKACCCGTGATHCAMKECEGEPTPAPVPAPAPKPIDLGLACESMPRPIGETPAITTAPHEGVVGESIRNFRALPQRLRQEALSIWRC